MPLRMGSVPQSSQFIFYAVLLASFAAVTNDQNIAKGLFLAFVTYAL